MYKIVIIVFLNLNLSLSTVLNNSGPSSTCLLRPLKTQPTTTLVNLKTLKGPNAVQKLHASKGLATIPPCLEFGKMLDRAVEQVSEFNIKKLLQKYDHLIQSRMATLMARIPPITAAYLSMSIIPFVLSTILGDQVVHSWMGFDLDKVMKGELWRLVTPYFMFGHLWNNFIMLSSCTLNYMGNVELAHVNNPEKFVEFLVFGFLTLSTFSIAEAYVARKHPKLSLNSYDNIPFHFQIYLLYLWSRINEGQKVECMDFFSIPAEYIPYLFILQNLIFSDGAVLSDAAAMLFSYLYFTLFSNRKACPLFKTEWLRKLYLKFRDEIPY